VNIWTKRAAGVGAIVGGLLLAGSVAASAMDLQPAGALSKLPLGGKTVPQHVSSVHPQQARPLSDDDDDEDGTTTGTRTGISTGNVNTNAPVNTCANTVSGTSGVATCKNNQDNFSAGKADVGGVGGVDAGDVVKTADGNANTNTPTNICTNNNTDLLGGIARCENHQRNFSVGEAAVGYPDEDR